MSDPKGRSIGFCIRGQMTREETLLHLSGSDSSLLWVAVIPPHWEISQTGDVSGKGEETPVKEALSSVPPLHPYDRWKSPNAKSHYHCNEHHHPQVHILGHSGRWKSRRCWHRFARRGSQWYTRSRLWKAKAHHRPFPQQNIPTDVAENALATESTGHQETRFPGANALHPGPLRSTAQTPECSPEDEGLHSHLPLCSQVGRGRNNLYTHIHVDACTHIPLQSPKLNFQVTSALSHHLTHSITE